MRLSGTLACSGKKKPRPEFEAGLNLRRMFENLPGPQVQACCNNRNRVSRKIAPGGSRRPGEFTETYKSINCFLMMDAEKTAPGGMHLAGGIYGDVN
jgi:hypothetical protein